MSLRLGQSQFRIENHEGFTEMYARLVIFGIWENNINDSCKIFNYLLNKRRINCSSKNMVVLVSTSVLDNKITC